MNTAQQKLVQYLNEAHATEQALVRVLQEQVAVTPRGSYRSGDRPSRPVAATARSSACAPGVSRSPRTHAGSYSRFP